MGAEIRLIPDGIGYLKLKNAVIDLKETSGGSFVSGKLYERLESEVQTNISCKVCDQGFETKTGLNHHIIEEHGKEECPNIKRRICSRTFLKKDR